MPSQAKIQKVEDLSQRLANSRSAALVQYQGLTAGEIGTLRAAIKSKGGIMEVTKNTLLLRAFEKAGTPLPEELTGPTAIAFSIDDEIAPLKELEKIGKEKEAIVFKYGYYEGKLLSTSELKQFLSLPSKSTLLSQLIGGLQNPLMRLVYAGKYQQTQLALVLKALSDKKSATA